MTSSRGAAINVYKCVLTALHVHTYLRLHEQDALWYLCVRWWYPLRVTHWARIWNQVSRAVVAVLNCTYWSSVNTQLNKHPTIRGLFDKSCNTHIRQLWILVLSPLLRTAASQKQMKLICKGLVATALKNLRLLGRGVGETDLFFLWFFIVFRLFVVKLLQRGDNFESHTT